MSQLEKRELLGNLRWDNVISEEEILSSDGGPQQLRVEISAGPDLKEVYGYVVEIDTGYDGQGYLALVSAIEGGRLYDNEDVNDFEPPDAANKLIDFVSDLLADYLANIRPRPFGLGPPYR